MVLAETWVSAQLQIRFVLEITVWYSLDADFLHPNDSQMNIGPKVAHLFTGPIARACSRCVISEPHTFTILVFDYSSFFKERGLFVIPGDQMTVVIFNVAITVLLNNLPVLLRSET